MTRKAKTEPVIKDKATLRVTSKEGESQDKVFAQIMAMPETQAARTIRQWRGSTPYEIDINETVAELREQTEAVKSGNMGRAEEMLLSQAHTLDELFNHLARKAKVQQYLPQFEAHLKLALKAQNQCRMTLESLSNIKNPPVVYARQANISHGPQQINNGTHAAETEIKQNELLTVNHGETLDSIRTGETIGGNHKVEALEK